ncbi:MAG: hypothetical protein EA426_00740, partial [Spirochaetaceae bacterium]
MNIGKTKKLLAFVAVVFGAVAVLSATPVSVGATAETGFLRALYHDIEIGRDTYRFNYVTEGGQELLLPYNRFEIETTIADRHELDFLYQPLTLETRTRVDSVGGITIDDVTFA